MGATTCKNCDTSYVGKYCPECGQKATVQRITLGYSIRTLIDVVFNLEQGLLATTRDLLVRPGTMLRGYMAGKRKSYVPPGRYILTVIALSYIINFSFGTETFSEGINEIQGVDSLREEEQGVEYMNFLFTFLQRNYSIITLSNIPFLALFMYWFFRKQPYNLGETVVVTTYLNAVGTLITLPIIILVKLGAISYLAHSASSMLLLLGYTLYALLHFYQPTKKFAGVFKATTAYGFGYFTWMIGLMVVMVSLAIQQGAFWDMNMLESWGIPADSTQAQDSLLIPDATATTPDSLFLEPLQ